MFGCVFGCVLVVFWLCFGCLFFCFLGFFFCVRVVLGSGKICGGDLGEVGFLCFLFFFVWFSGNWD